MNLLIIDTSCDSLTIALKVGEKLYPYKSMSARQGHSVLLLPAINDLLNESGITINDVDYFSAITGPGSFTGIRIGVATVNAFAYANDKKVVDVTAFEPFAYNGDKAFAYAIDAKHGNYYLAKKAENGELIYSTLEGEELPQNTVVLPVTEVTPEMLMNALEKKIKLGKASDIVKPFYMRASEAERNRKE